jgi:glycosyltransferase involved in cell wall biosynthesis
MKFSLIIPCYNEAKNIPTLLDRCQQLTSRSDLEVVLVDNGSTDDTPVVLQALLPLYLSCRSIRIEQNQGYGFGILSGLNVATGDILGWTHADLQTDPQDLLFGIEFFEKNGINCFVKGSRIGRPLADTIFTMGMSFFETLLLAKPLWDINAQPTMFSRIFFETWHEPPNDFSLDLFAYYQARALGLKVFRFPVMFGERVYGMSHWNVDWISKWKFILRTIDYSFKLRGAIKK